MAHILPAIMLPVASDGSLASAQVVSNAPGIVPGQNWFPDPIDLSTPQFGEIPVEQHSIPVHQNHLVGFSKLPVEIRLIIWALASLNTGRTIHFRVANCASELWCVASSILSLLGVNREARSVAIKEYATPFNDDNMSTIFANPNRFRQGARRSYPVGPLYFNFSRDLVYIDVPKRWAVQLISGFRVRFLSFERLFTNILRPDFLATGTLKRFAINGKDLYKHIEPETNFYAWAPRSPRSELWLSEIFEHLGVEEIIVVSDRLSPDDVYSPVVLREQYRNELIVKEHYLTEHKQALEEAFRNFNEDQGLEGDDKRKPSFHLKAMHRVRPGEQLPTQEELDSKTKQIVLRGTKWDFHKKLKYPHVRHNIV